MFGGSAEGKENYDVRKAEIEESPSYGGTIDIALRPGSFLEVSYSRQDTTLAMRSTYEGLRHYEFDVQYLQFGGLQEFRLPGAEWFRPIVGATVGATVFQGNDPVQDYDYTEWRFSVLLEGGAKLRIIDQFGIRLRARLLTTFLPEQTALICGTGAGCGYAYQGTAMFQGELGGGIYVGF